MHNSKEPTEDLPPPGRKRRVMVGAIGKCVHNLGVEGFADWEEPYSLRPHGSVLLDAHYLVSILGGLYGRVYPEQALKVMKRELVPLDVEALVRERVLAPA